MGYSFGGALALKLAADMKPRVKNMVLVSGVVNSHISQKDTLIRLIKLLRFSRLHLPLKLISKVQTYQIKKILIKEGNIPIGFLGRYIDMVNKIDYKVIIESIYQLFTSDYTKYLNKVDDIPSLVISSKDEYKLFVQQSEFLRKKLVNHKSLYTEGTHEDFMISSNQKIVEQIINFLKN